MGNRTAAYRGRPLPTHTKLGQLMTEHGDRAYILSGKAGIPTRTLTEYLAGRKEIQPQHMTRLCDIYDCEPEDLIDDTIYDDLEMDD